MHSYVKNQKKSEFERKWHKKTIIIIMKFPNQNDYIAVMYKKITQNIFFFICHFPVTSNKIQIQICSIFLKHKIVKKIENSSNILSILFLTILYYYQIVNT